MWIIIWIQNKKKNKKNPDFPIYILLHALAEVGAVRVLLFKVTITPDVWGSIVNLWSIITTIMDAGFKVAVPLCQI